MKKDILTVRLGAREQRLLSETRKRLKLSRSEVVREAIARYAAQTAGEEGMTPADRWAPYLGVVKGADPGLSQGTRSRVRRILRAKHERRSG